MAYGITYWAMVHGNGKAWVVDGLVGVGLVAGAVSTTGSSLSQKLLAGLELWNAMLAFELLNAALPSVLCLEGCLLLLARGGGGGGGAAAAAGSGSAARRGARRARRADGRSSSTRNICDLWVDV